MLQYGLQFIVFTLAMIGVLVLACVVYKKTMQGGIQGKNSNLKITDMLRLPDRKIIYVISYGKENFLIASSQDKATLISKLEDSKEEIENISSFGVEVINEAQSKGSLLKKLSDNNRTKRGNY